MKFIVEILLTGLAVVLAAYFIPGVSVDTYLTAIVAGVLLGLANATIGTVLRILTFPINFITLGLMSFVITVFMVLLVDSWLDGFHTSGFFSAMVFAAVLAIIKMIFGILTPDDNDD